MSIFKYKATVPGIEFWKRMVPCQAACPVHTDAGKYVQLIACGDHEHSYLIARSPNPLASICGRVCAAPCEDQCRRGKIDAPVSIRALKRFACEKHGVESLLPDTQETLFRDSGPGVGNTTAWHLPHLIAGRGGRKTRHKVAVVGAGPAGLACAHDLGVMGYDVTIFEATSAVGGMMINGIPEFRLPRAVIEKEVEKILQLGVRLKLNAPLSSSFGVQELRRDGYLAIFLAIGTQRGRDLSIEGVEHDGVIRAVDFLLNVNRGYRVDLGQKVVVIGGGFVAFDAARTALRAVDPDAKPETGDSASGTVALDAARAALRAGVVEVSMCSLESFEEMPALRTEQGREEFEEARREGIEFHPQRGPKRIIGEDGRVTAIELVGVERTYDSIGRFNPIYNDGLREVLAADSVILAVGQQADLSFLKPEDGVQVTPRGTIAIDSLTLATSAAGIYAGGDVAFGPRNLIDAIANGKRAAISIDDYLGSVLCEAPIQLEVEQVPTRTWSMAPGYEKLSRQAPPSVPLDRRTGISEVETGYSEQEARRQAERCLYCHVQTIYDVDKCVLCNRCVDVCPEFCLKLVPLEDVELDLDPAIVRRSSSGGAGIASATATGTPTADSSPLPPGDELDGQPMSAMIKDDEKCIRCGLCAIRCPTGAMTMEVFHYVEQERVAPQPEYPRGI